MAFEIRAEIKNKNPLISTAPQISMHYRDVVRQFCGTVILISSSASCCRQVQKNLQQTMPKLVDVLLWFWKGLWRYKPKTENYIKNFRFVKICTYYFNSCNSSAPVWPTTAPLFTKMTAEVRGPLCNSQELYPEAAANYEISIMDWSTPLSKSRVKGIIDGKFRSQDSVRQVQ